MLDVPDDKVSHPSDLSLRWAGMGVSFLPAFRLLLKDACTAAALLSMLVV